MKKLDKETATYYEEAPEVIRASFDNLDPFQVKIVNKSNNDLPVYETEKSAGMDLKADIPEGTLVKINPGEIKLIGTGIFVELPDGLEMQIRPRSGLALKHGITVLNSPGTIDPDYRGEVKVILINHSDSSLLIGNGDRIAQAVFSRFERVRFKEVKELSETKRGKGGFGHTGGHR